MELKAEALQILAPIIAGLRAFHRHQVVGMSHIPKKGPLIFAANHSLASYDMILMMGAVHDFTNRIPRSLVDRLFYKVPGLGALIEAMGSLEGNHQNATKLLNDDQIVVLAPGGMRESLRPSSQKYKIIWKKRKGFIKLSIETGAPIILAACPAADDIYDVMPSHVTAWAYRTFKIPVFFAKGVAFTPIPKPVKLVHHLSEPLYPPKPSANPEELDHQIDVFHGVVCKRMDELMRKAARDSASQEDK
jgi:1-acyl-sn-glycerol-3-phosphate acyltransferase